MLPGWFGFGSGLTAALEQHGEEVVAQMLAHWPFFGHLLDDVEAMLARTDLDIAGHYDALAGEALRAHAAAIRKEYALTVTHVLRLRGSARLLDSDPTLQRSIKLRNPYIDPMHLMQVDLLRRWRSDGARGSGAVRRAARHHQRHRAGAAGDRLDLAQHSGTLTARPPCEVSL